MRQARFVRMARKELDVFLSSDQDEFLKVRKALSKTVCSIPFLTCTPLENRGAESTNVRESSLKAVRDSDVYIGVFGREYSETTIQEYREAIKCKKPCLIYVKKVKTRDSRLSKFIYDDLRNEFKFSPFRGQRDLCGQIDSDLRRFILETLSIGLDERAKKKEETIALIEKEEKTKPKIIEGEDPITRAESAFGKNNYVECLVMTTVALELNLRKALMIRNVVTEGKPLGALIQLAAKSEILDPFDVARAREVSHFRNIAVHQGDAPSRETTKWVLDNAKLMIERLRAGANIGEELVSKAKKTELLPRREKLKHSKLLLLTRSDYQGLENWAEDTLIENLLKHSKDQLETSCVMQHLETGYKDTFWSPLIEYKGLMEKYNYPIVPIPSGFRGVPFGYEQSLTEPFERIPENDKKRLKELKIHLLETIEKIIFGVKHGVPLKGKCEFCQNT